MKFTHPEHTNAELILVSTHRPDTVNQLHRMANIKTDPHRKRFAEIFYGIASVRYPIPALVVGVRVTASATHPFGHIIDNSHGFSRGSISVYRNYTAAAC